MNSKARCRKYQRHALKRYTVKRDAQKIRGMRSKERIYAQKNLGLAKRRTTHAQFAFKVRWNTTRSSTRQHTIKAKPVDLLFLLHGSDSKHAFRPIVPYTNHANVTDFKENIRHPTEIFSWCMFCTRCTRLLWRETFRMFTRGTHCHTGTPSITHRGSAQCLMIHIAGTTHVCTWIMDLCLEDV